MASCTDSSIPIEVPVEERSVRVLQAGGEHPSENELEVPEGAAFRATNVVVDKPNIYAAHRGLIKSVVAGHTLSSFTYYRGAIVAHSQADGLLLKYEAGSWSTYSGTYYAPVSAEVVSFDENAGSLFFTTSTGVYRLDGTSSQPQLSGLPQALPGVVALAGSGSALSDGFATAYRANWAYNADDGGGSRLIEGAPSPRLVVANAAGSTQNVTVTLPIPDGLPDGAYLRLFRADEVPTATDISPLDEMRQVYERAPTPAELTARSMTITDSTPDTVKGSSAYWAPNSGDGLAQSNYAAPLVAALTHYSESEFGVGVSGVQRIQMTLLGSDALVAGNGLRFTRGLAFESYTAGAAEAFPNTFKLFTGGTPAQNTAATVDSLVRAINSRISGFLRAFPLDVDGSQPGAFLIEARDLDQTHIIVEATGDAQAWAPAPLSRISASATRPLASSTVTVSSAYEHGLVAGQQINIISSSAPSIITTGIKTVATVPTNFTFTFTQAGVDGGAGIEFTTLDELVQTESGTVDNAYAWTKRFEPDHWPLANLGTVGGSRDALWWGLPMDRWYFLGSDAGLFRINGNADDGFISPEEGAPWDSSCAFLGRRNAAALDGQAYAISKRGLVTWGEGQKPQNVDGPIQKEIRAAVAQYPDAVAKYGFLFADATNHRLYVALPESSAATSATIVHVWNGLTGTWTRLTSAFPGFEGGLVDGMAPIPEAGQEYFLPASGGTRDGQLLFTRNSGDAADFQGPEGQGLQCKVTYMPWTAGDPLRAKMWTRTSVYTKAGISRLTFGYATDYLPTEETQTYPDIDPEGTQPVLVSDPIQGLAWRSIIGNEPDNSYLRGRKLSVSVAHNEPGEEFQLYGVEVFHRVYGNGQ